MENKEKKDNPLFIALMVIWLLGPIVAGTVLFCMNHLLAGILVIVIPYLCLFLTPIS